MKSVPPLGDSYGAERSRNGEITVPMQLTFGEIVRSRFPNLEVSCNFKKFRKITECFEIIKEDNSADILFIHAGIVDVFPRPLNQKMTNSSKLFPKIIRFLSQRFRKEFLNYIYNKPWSTDNEIANAIKDIISLRKDKITYFINITPVIYEWHYIAPGCQVNLFRFNELLQKFADNKNVFIIDMQAETIKNGFLQYIDEKDSHFNIRGNELLANIITQEIIRIEASIAK